HHVRDALAGYSLSPLRSFSTFKSSGAAFTGGSFGSGWTALALWAGFSLGSCRSFWAFRAYEAGDWLTVSHRRSGRPLRAALAAWALCSGVALFALGPLRAFWALQRSEEHTSE